MGEGRDRDAAEIDPVEIHPYSVGSNAESDTHTSTGMIGQRSRGPGDHVAEA